MTLAVHKVSIEVANYNLDATLDCGQAFRWTRLSGGGWQGVAHGCFAEFAPAAPGGLSVEVLAPTTRLDWLADYLGLTLDYAAVMATFPKDPAMKAAVKSCRGLRLLRQEPWECLASFILSSVKQITQIRAGIERVCRAFGEFRPIGTEGPGFYTFPTPAQLASASEAALRKCGLGFRAPHLRAAARAVADGKLDLEDLRGLACAEAREELVALNGVGPKIANCVLLFAFGFQEAFPVDVWVARALRELYFQGRAVPLAELEQFSANHFGPYRGYAQQFLFHYMRKHHDASKPPQEVA